MLRPLVLGCTALLALVPASRAAAQEVAPAPPPGGMSQPSTQAAPATAPLSLTPCECVPERLGPAYSFWGGVSVMRWRVSDSPFATPLATTGEGIDAGVLGDPATVVLFGGNSLDYGSFNGMRIHAGGWLNDSHTWGLGGSYSAFESRGSTFLLDSATGPAFIARPFFDARTNTQAAVVVATPGDDVDPTVLAGTLAIQTAIKFDSFDLHVRRNLWADEGFIADALLGYRYFNLRESLDIRQSTVFVSGPDGTPLVVGGEGNPVESQLISDSFRTRNRIHGVQLGLRAELERGAFFVSAVTKVTLGVNQQRIEINGSTQGTNALGDVLTESGGVLAVSGRSQELQPPVIGDLPPIVGNLGGHRYNQFIVMPELGVQAGVRVTSALRVYIGYDLLYINDVVRPGTQIDPAVNQTFIPSSINFGLGGGEDAPNVTRARHDFFAHGVNVGIEFQF